MSLPLELQLFWKLAFPQVPKSTVYFQVYMLSGTQDKTPPPPPPWDNFLEFLECLSVYSIVTAVPSLLSLVTAKHVTFGQNGLNWPKSHGFWKQFE